MEQRERTATDDERDRRELHVTAACDWCEKEEKELQQRGRLNRTRDGEYMLFTAARVGYKSQNHTMMTVRFAT